jgi:hypothetical protein
MGNAKLAEHGIVINHRTVNHQSGTQPSYARKVGPTHK